MTSPQQAAGLSSCSPQAVSAAADSLVEVAAWLQDQADATAQLVLDDESWHGPSKNAYRIAAGCLEDWQTNAATACTAAGQALARHAEVLASAQPVAEGGEALYAEGSAYVGWARSYSGRTLDLASIGMVMQYFSAGLDLQEDGAGMMLSAAQTVEQSAAVTAEALHQARVGFEEPASRGSATMVSAVVAGPVSVALSGGQTSSTTGALGVPGSTTSPGADGDSGGRLRTDLAPLPVTPEDLRARQSATVVAQATNDPLDPNYGDPTPPPKPRDLKANEQGYTGNVPVTIESVIENRGTGTRILEFGFYDDQVPPWKRAADGINKYPYLLMPHINSRIAIWERGVGYGGFYNGLALQTYSNSMTKRSQADRQAMRVGLDLAAEFSNDRQRAVADIQRQTSTAVHNLGLRTNEYLGAVSNSGTATNADENTRREASNVQKNRNLEVQNIEYNSGESRREFVYERFLENLVPGEEASINAYALFTELREQGVPAEDALLAVEDRYPGRSGIPFSDPHPYTGEIPTLTTSTQLVDGKLPQAPIPADRSAELGAHQQQVAAAEKNMIEAAQQLRSLQGLPAGTPPQIQQAVNPGVQPTLNLVTPEAVRDWTKYDDAPVEGSSGTSLLEKAGEIVRRGKGFPTTGNWGADFFHALAYNQQITAQTRPGGGFDQSFEETRVNAELQGVGENQRAKEVESVNERNTNSDNTLRDTTNLSLAQRQDHAQEQQASAIKIQASTNATQEQIQGWQREWDSTLQSYYDNMAVGRQQIVEGLGTGHEQTTGTQNLRAIAFHNDMLDEYDVNGNPVDYYYDREAAPAVNRIINDVLGGDRDRGAYFEPGPWQEEIITIGVNQALKEGIITQAEADYYFTEMLSLPNESNFLEKKEVDYGFPVGGQ
ncbi:MAG: hypothetical protein ACRCZD_15330 [Phycicoccus sp.]